MKFGVAVFPGSNCDYDTYFVIDEILGKPVKFLHWEDRRVDVDCVVIPGGFSFGDYLRPGALAARTPLAEAIYDFAQRGGLVIGICNGFQILTEMHLLPGALLPNEHLKFVCRPVYLRVENARTPFTRALEEGEVLQIPIAHHDGNFYAPPEQLEEIEKNGQVVLRYCSPEGEVSPEYNPNGSLNNIAGIVNKEGNVFGLMPHPERAGEAELGSTGGLPIWYSLLQEV
ncbi:MAG: phosphoribosylformylglycinamidine synthase I [Aquificae bacterium]|nr:phosphoribosylformylglycinamidine synthase I [Aquificota bacterium]